MPTPILSCKSSKQVKKEKSSPTLDTIKMIEETVKSNNHKYTKTVGQNSGGYVHFGNMGLIVLPNSQIIIQMATDFWKYKDGRFIEFIGHTPDIKVRKGKDALGVVLKEVSKTLEEKQ